MSHKTIKINNAEAVVKKACFLAYEACGDSSGMGFLQARDAVSEDDVWNNIMSSGDYPGPSHNKPGKVYGDYVFGRMMKIHFEYTADSITYYTGELDVEYQGWCLDYPTYLDLINSAVLFNLAGSSANPASGENNE